MAKKQKRRRGRIDPFTIYINARGFWFASEVLGKQPHESILMWPLMSNQAFALELHLKCLHRLRRRYVAGHDIGDLFYKLSKADQRTLARYYIESVRSHPNYLEFAAKGLPLDMESALTRSSDMFIKGRYWHEGELPRRDAGGFSSSAGLGQITDAINRLLLELNPDWPEKIHAFRFSLPGIRQLTT